jgi:hypothetical protein
MKPVMKRTLLTLLLGAVAAGAFAVTDLYRYNLRHPLRNAFKKGQYAFGLGPGFGNLQHPNGNDYLMYGTVTGDYTFPITFSAEYGLTSFLGIGIFFDHFTSTIEVEDNTDPSNKNGFEYKSSSFVVCGAYHLYLGRNYNWIDPYARAGIGFRALKSTPFGDNNIFEPNKGGFAWTTVAGVNIYPMQALGVFVEAGYGINIGQAGVILRF